MAWRVRGAELLVSWREKEEGMGFPHSPVEARLQGLTDLPAGLMSTWPDTSRCAVAWGRSLRHMGLGGVFMIRTTGWGCSSMIGHLLSMHRLWLSPQHGEKKDSKPPNSHAADCHMGVKDRYEN